MTIWKDVVGYEGRYQVSDDGYIKSLPNQTRSTTRILKFGYDSDGYRSVQLYNGSGKLRRRKVHLLLLEAFVGPRPDGMLGCHGDDNRSNNTLNNLRWDTVRANINDAIRNDVLAKGERNGGGKKLLESQVSCIKSQILIGESKRALASKYGVSEQLIHKIGNGKLWRHVA